MENLARIHKHELSDLETEQIPAIPQEAAPVAIPTPANDDEPLHPIAANDNEAIQKLAEVREHLGLIKGEVPQAVELQTENPSVAEVIRAAEELPQATPEAVPAVVEQAEAPINHDNAPEESAVQAAGGAERGGGGGGGGGAAPEAGTETPRPRKASGRFRWIGKALKGVLITLPVFLLGVITTTVMNALKKTTTVTLDDLAKVSKSSGKKQGGAPGGGHGGGGGAHP